MDELETRKEIIRRMVQAFEELAVADGMAQELPAPRGRRSVSSKVEDMLQDIEVTVGNLVKAWSLEAWYIEHTKNGTYYPELEV